MFFSRVKSLLLITLISAAVAQNARNGCPGDRAPDGIITAANGEQFAVCHDTDFLGGDTGHTDGIQSTEELAEECSKRDDCYAASRTRFFSSGYYKNLVGVTGFISANIESIYRITASDADDRASLGSWGPVVEFPVIPAGVFMVAECPKTTRMMMFAAYEDKVFGNNVYIGRTQFAEFNLGTGEVIKRTISNTRHDMFCPGISALEDGKVVITGGSNAERTSIYDPSTNEFISGPNMTTARGYQSSCTLSGGKIFTIGGSWSGGIKIKDGEFYNPTTNRWTALPGALVEDAMTADIEADKRDNHHWLFGWKDNSIFQAGPSMQMHWWSAKGQGSVMRAGVRDNVDAMNGMFAMFDGLRGKILTAGGAPNYHAVAANNRAHLITIGEYGTEATVETLPDMTLPRTFANMVILPDGSCFIIGGQQIAQAFTDYNSTLIPEMFDPTKKTFRQLAPMKTPRNYHSTALLLPDGRVFAGGGGLCHALSNRCPEIGSNHADAELYSPPYLFNSDGSYAQRPVITELSSDSANDGTRVRPGEHLTVTVEEPEDGLTFSLVRLGTSTHTVNTDQRRVPLENVRRGGGSRYMLALPSDSGIVIPGDWFLFVMSSKGTPSLARSVKVTL